MPADDRRHLAGRDRDHDLVEQRHALSVFPSRISAWPWPSRAEGHEVRVAEPLADLGGLAEGGVRGRGVALGKALQRHRHEQVALLHAVVWPSSSSRRARASQPPPRASSPLEQQPEGQPERTAGGSLGIAAAHKRRDARAPRASALSSSRPDQVSGHREPLEILRPKRAARSAADSWAYAPPGPPPEGLPAPIECLSRVHTRSRITASHARAAAASIPTATRVDSALVRIITHP